jgi:hypothetical protein
MDRLVKILEGRPTDARAIVDFCTGAPQFVRYSELKNMSGLDDIFGEHGMCLLLYDTANVGHFVTLIRLDAQTIEYFDSYGDIPEEFIKDKRFRFLTRLIVGSNCDVVANDNKLQRLSRDIATCGRHCAARLRMWMEHKTSLDDYCTLMEKNKGDPDKLVTLLTFFM